MLSVLVITYNSEKTLSRCIDSILKQSFSEFELIIIDDGSADRSLDVLLGYASVDSRICVVSRENLGIAASRQEALELAKGEYVIFVDADDWVEPNFLEALYEEAINSNSEMVICDFIIERAENVEYSSQKPISKHPNVVLAQMINDLYGTLWNKLISRDVYARTGVSFVPDMNCCEDQYVVLSLLANDISLSYVPKALYHYDKTANAGSITNNWYTFPVSQRVQFIKYIEPLIVDDFQMQCYNNYIGRIAFDATSSPKSACPNYRQLFKEYKKEIAESNLSLLKKTICNLRILGVPVPVRFVKTLRTFILNLKRKYRC